MKLAVISNSHVPSTGTGNNGLGSSAHQLATGLAERGHDVTLFAGRDSAFDAGQLMIIEDETKTFGLLDGFDGILDTSHWHALSKFRPDLPVVNRMADLECDFNPPCAVVESRFMQRRIPRARLIHKGVDADRIPFTAEHQGYLAYYSRVHPLKGIVEAMQVADMLGRELRIAGQNAIDAEFKPPHIYVGELTGDARWQFVGGAEALLFPTHADASPRTPLEAAACGTPVICFEGTGATDYVEDCLSGFIIESVQEMAEAVYDVPLLDRLAIRQWASGTFPLSKWIDAYEAALAEVADGSVW